MPKQSAEQISELIGAIYDCAIDPARWEATLAEIRDALDCHAAFLHLDDLRHDRLLIQKSVGIEPSLQHVMAKHMPEINANMATALASWRSLDEPHIASRHLPRAYLETSPYIQECWRPEGIVDTIQFFLIYTPTRFSAMALARHESQGVIYRA
jgi:hypothetical protein